MLLFPYRNRSTPRTFRNNLVMHHRFTRSRRCTHAPSALRPRESRDSPRFSAGDSRPRVARNSVMANSVTGHFPFGFFSDSAPPRENLGPQTPHPSVAGRSLKCKSPSGTKAKSEHSGRADAEDRERRRNTSGASAPSSVTLRLINSIKSYLDAGRKSSRIILIRKILFSFAPGQILSAGSPD